MRLGIVEPQRIACVQVNAASLTRPFTHADVPHACVHLRPARRWAAAGLVHGNDPIDDLIWPGKPHRPCGWLNIR